MFSFFLFEIKHYFCGYIVCQKRKDIYQNGVNKRGI